MIWECHDPRNLETKESGDRWMHSTRLPPFYRGRDLALIIRFPLEQHPACPKFQFHQRHRPRLARMDFFQSPSDLVLPRLLNVQIRFALIQTLDQVGSDSATIFRRESKCLLKNVVCLGGHAAGHTRIVAPRPSVHNWGLGVRESESQPLFLSTTYLRPIPHFPAKPRFSPVH
jgi:hypothetical protein